MDFLFPKKLRLFLLFACGQLLVTGRAGAGLNWASTRFDATPGAKEKELTAVFRFTNQGPATVQITQVRAACGCTTTSLAKKTYAAGESGEITARFVFGDAVGIQDKTITVETDEPNAPNTTLWIHAVIPEFLTFTKRIVVWRIGEPAHEEAVFITSAQPLRQLEASVVNEAVRTKVEPTGIPNQYRLLLQPRSTHTLANIPILVTATLANGSTRIGRAYVLVR